MLELFRANKLPDQNWLITIVHILMPNHEIFGKDYVYKKE